MRPFHSFASILLSISVMISFMIMRPSLSVTAASTWTSIGPFGGRIHNVIVDRIAPTTLYAAADGGLFRTTNDAEEWALIASGSAAFVSVDIEYLSASTQIYAARQNNNAGDGVMRSSDGGATWSTITAGLPTNVSINTIVINPYGIENIWLGTNSGLFRWDSDSDTWEATTLTYKTHVLAFAKDFVLAGVTGPESNFLLGGVYKSNFGSSIWTPITGNLPEWAPSQSRSIRSLAIDYRNSNIIYAGSSYGGSNGLYKTIDGGANWIPIANNALDNGYLEYTKIVVHPTNPDIVYVATSGYFNQTNHGGVYKSTDAGGSWSNASTGLSNLYIRSLAINPANPNALYVGTDGAGVSRTTNSGNSWFEKNFKLGSQEILKITEISGILYALTGRDGIYRSLDKGASWERFNSGMTPGITLHARAITSDNNGHIFAFIRREQTILQNQPTSQVGIYRLKGTTWESVTHNLPNVDASDMTVASNLLILTARNQSGSNNDEIFVSGDGGIQWTPQNTGLPNETNPRHIRDLQVRWDGNVYKLFAATNQGLYASPISPISWNVTGTGIASTDIRSLTIDPGNPNVIYAATWGYVYKSMDGGNSWTQRRNGISNSDYGIFSIAINPINTTQLWIGGDTNIYKSSDSGAFWSAESNADPTLKRPISLYVVGSNGFAYVGTRSSIWTNGSIVVKEPIRKPWTILAYLNGDNNLDAAIYQAFNKLEIAAANENIQIIALWDRRGNGNTIKYRVQSDQNPLLLSSAYVEGENMWSQRELNMGSPTTLAAFIRDVRTSFPADHYFLTIVDHGGGWSISSLDDGAKRRWYLGGSGMSWDDTNGYQYLSSNAMREVLEEAAGEGGKFDIVMYDACLMGMVEEAYQIRNAADYFIASESQNWASFPYDHYLQPVGQNTTARELGIHIVNIYHTSLSGYPRTMSVLDLSRMEAVRAALDSFSAALLDLSINQKTQVIEAYTLTQKFDFNTDLTITNVDGYVDLVDFARHIQERLPGTGAAEQAGNLIGILTQGTQPFIAYERHESGIFPQSNSYFNLDHANGVAIYMPFGGKDDLDANYYIASSLDLAAYTRWDDFIQAYLLSYPPQDIGRANGNPGDDPILRGPFFPSLVYLPSVSSP